MTSRHIRKLTPIEIAFAALLVWGVLSPQLGCRG